MGPRLVQREDEDVSAAIHGILASEGIDVRLNARCISLDGNQGQRRGSVDCTDGSPTVEGSHLLLAVGRRPNTDDLGLDAAGVGSRRPRLHRRGRPTADERPGDLGAGRLQRQGRVHAHVLQRFRDRRRQPARRRLPACIDRIPAYALYIDPPLGRAGLTESEARRRGHAVLVGTRPMTRVGRAIEKGETRA